MKNLLIATLAMALFNGQAAEERIWIRPSADNAALELNFIGLSVVDWQMSFAYYTKSIAVGVKNANALYGNWAMLGEGWDAYWSEKSRSMIFELFDGGPPVRTERKWGRGQGMRPSIQVENLDATITALRRRRVRFTSEVEQTDWGKRIEFTGPEDIRWTLSEVPGRPASSDLAKPLIGHIEIRANSFAGQTAFYRDVMGMRLESTNRTRAILVQGPNKPWVVIEPGGEPQTIHPEWAAIPAHGQPIFLSFMTYNVELAAAAMRKAGVRILHEVEHHPDWMGKDLIIADVDGNVIQVVQLDQAPRSAPE
ncbi:MAG: VOC family protein [Verrucomicrobia bacterium]|nr:VOC family protein [Verrucomicrobiota bacterium]